MESQEDGAVNVHFPRVVWSAVLIKRKRFMPFLLQVEAKLND